MKENKPRVLSVNIGKSEPNPFKTSGTTGIFKKPAGRPVLVNVPLDGGSSGLDGDYIGDRENHGGPDQAVYAFQREDLDRWGRVKGRRFDEGAFGENLTTVGIDVNDALIGEQWRIGTDLVLEATGPRIPCMTFRGIMDTPKWLKEFTADARPGTYFKVLSPGLVSAGDEIEVIHQPPHDVSVSVAFKAITTDRSLVARLRAASDYLSPELVEYAATAVVDTDPE